MSRAGPARLVCGQRWSPGWEIEVSQGPSLALGAGPSCLFQLLVPGCPLARGCLLPLCLSPRLSLCLSAFLSLIRTWHWT